MDINYFDRFGQRYKVRTGEDSDSGTFNPEPETFP